LRWEIIFALNLINQMELYALLIELTHH